MNEESIKMMAKLLGVEEKDLYKGAAYEFMVKLTVDLTALALFLKQHKVMTEESINRYEQAVKNYFSEVNLIMAAEADIERLRGLE